jgi:hypothetical protein
MLSGGACARLRSRSATPAARRGVDGRDNPRVKPGDGHDGGFVYINQQPSRVSA